VSLFLDAWCSFRQESFFSSSEGCSSPLFRGCFFSLFLRRFCFSATRWEGLPVAPRHVGWGPGGELERSDLHAAPGAGVHPVAHPRPAALLQRGAATSVFVSRAAKGGQGRPTSRLGLAAVLRLLLLSSESWWLGLINAASLFPFSANKNPAPPPPPPVVLPRP